MMWEQEWPYTLFRLHFKRHFISGRFSHGPTSNIPHYAEFALPMLPNKNTCHCPVRKEKSPSFTTSACSTFQKVGFITHSSGNASFVTSPRATIPYRRLFQVTDKQVCSILILIPTLILCINKRSLCVLM